MQRDIDTLVRYLGADLGITKGGYLVKNAMPGQGVGIRQGGKFYAPGAKEEGGGEELVMLSLKGVTGQKVPVVPPPQPPQRVWQLWATIPELEEFPTYSVSNILSAGSYQGDLYLILEVKKTGNPTKYALTRYDPVTNTQELISADLTWPFARNMVEWGTNLCWGAMGYYDGSNVHFFTETEWYADGITVLGGALYGISGYGIQRWESTTATPTMLLEFPGDDNSFKVDWWTSQFAEDDGVLYAAIRFSDLDADPRQYWLRFLRISGSSCTTIESINTTGTLDEECRPLAMAYHDDTLKMVAWSLDDDDNLIFQLWSKGTEWEQESLLGQWYSNQNYQACIFQYRLWFYDDTFIMAERPDHGGIYQASGIPSPLDVTKAGLFEFDGTLYMAVNKQLFAYTSETPPA